MNRSFRRLLMILAAGGWPLCPSASAEITRALDDWYSLELPVFVSDVAVDPARDEAYVSDQITGRIFRMSLTDGSTTAITHAGFEPSREEVLSLVSNTEAFERLLEGEIKLEWDGSRLTFFDGRAVFGSERWLDVILPERPGDAWKLTPRDAPLTVPAPRIRDQSILMQAVADMAGRGRRLKPWRWSSRGDMFQLIDRSGRAFLFSVESGVFGQKRLRFVAEIASLFSRLSDLSGAELESEGDTGFRLRIGERRWRSSLVEDPYTGDRMIDLEDDTDAASRRLSPVKKSPPRLSQSLQDFFRQPKVLAEGPAGQLISCKIRLTDLGILSLLILTKDDQVRMIPWQDAEPEAADVVVFPEGFAVKSPPLWRLLGWTSDFSGYASFGNSRFERMAPVLSTAQDGGAETSAVTTGAFVLDAEVPSLSSWPVVEWPRYASISELRMAATPLDLAVDRQGIVYVMAQDAAGGRAEEEAPRLRIFRVSEALEPVLDLPPELLPKFFPGEAPTLISKTETKQTLWALTGQPPTLVRKETFGIVWSAGQQIAWKPEPDGVILFSTDPTGESDTAVTVVVEGAGEVRQAVRLRKSIWLIETDSGILKLDASDATAPEVLEVSPDGEGLRSAAGGALFTVPWGGTSEVRFMGVDGKDQSLGRFRQEWLALGDDGKRLFFQDRSTSKMFAVRRPSPVYDEGLGEGHISGRVEFHYDDPSGVYLCFVGDAAHVARVSPEAQTFLVGPMSAGMYRLDVSAGLYDLAGPSIHTVTQSELALPDIKLSKSLDFIFRRAVAFEESKNDELAKFNYKLYLDLYPNGRMADRARSRIVALSARTEQWEDMIEFYQKSPAETVWDREVLLTVMERLPTLAERFEMARKQLKVSSPDGRSAELLFFLYRYSRDPQYKSSARLPGIPPVYRKFFDSFDLIQK